ncbi:hypothetical protein B0H21DRAFT_822981 [Amylocystis lapponica]|nr:hypothetical protein B0H21DRAFT_822981 [Amylocystis lapponica]
MPKRKRSHHANLGDWGLKKELRGLTNKSPPRTIESGSVCISAQSTSDSGEGSRTAGTSHLGSSPCTNEHDLSKTSPSVPSPKRTQEDAPEGSEHATPTLACQAAHAREPSVPLPAGMRNTGDGADSEATRVPVPARTVAHSLERGRGPSDPPEMERVMSPVIEPEVAASGWDAMDCANMPILGMAAPQAGNSDVHARDVAGVAGTQSGAVCDDWPFKAVAEDGGDEDEEMNLWQGENLREAEVPGLVAGPNSERTWSRRHPPTVEMATSAYRDLTEILSPRRKTGKGYKDPHLNSVLRKRLEWMKALLWIFIDPRSTVHGVRDTKWIAASAQVAATATRGPWFARQLRKWVWSFIRNRSGTRRESGTLSRR